MSSNLSTVGIPADCWLRVPNLTLLPHESVSLVAIPSLVSLKVIEHVRCEVINRGGRLVPARLRVVNPIFLEDGALTTSELCLSLSLDADTERFMNDAKSGNR